MCVWVCGCVGGCVWVCVCVCVKGIPISPWLFCKYIYTTIAVGGESIAQSFYLGSIVDQILFLYSGFYRAWFLSTIFPFLRPLFVQYVNLCAHLKTQCL